MDSKSKEDPFDLFNPKKFKFRDFLIFKESADEETKYIIKETTNSKAQNLLILHYLQNLIKSSPDINSKKVLNYLKQQRIFIKRYLKRINHPSSQD